MKKILSVEHVSKIFGEDKVLSDISFVGEEGEIIGFVGHNGSGKTVLLKCICGLLQASEGKIEINGKKVGIGKNMPHNIGLLIEEPAFLNDYSGYKNLDFLYRMRNKKNPDLLKAVMTIVGLDWKSRKKVKKYSLGMRQRLAIAQVIMEEPEILILDEPMNGLDKNGIKEMRELFLEKKRQNKLLLLASHSREDIEYLCDRVYELENGIMRERDCVET